MIGEEMKPLQVLSCCLVQKMGKKIKALSAREGKLKQGSMKYHSNLKGKLKH
jgi:hypothetical protein